MFLKSWKVCRCHRHQTLLTAPAELKQTKTTPCSSAGSPLLPASYSRGSLGLHKTTAKAFDVCISSQPQQCLPSAARLGVSPETSAAGPLYVRPRAKEGVTSAWPCPPVVLKPAAGTFLNMQKQVNSAVESPRPVWPAHSNTHNLTLTLWLLWKTTQK